MQVLESNPNIGIDIVPDELSVLDRWVWSSLFSNLARDSQWSYIRRGTTRIDEDPSPGTLGDVSRRVEDDFQGRLYVVSFEPAPDSQVSRADGNPLGNVAVKSDALKGMAVFEATSDTFEIYECNVRSDSRKQKIARAMLRLGAHFMSGQREVIADVHEDNPAQEVWEHYGLVLDPGVPPEPKGVFSGNHLRYHASSAEFRSRLDLTQADTFV